MGKVATSPVPYRGSPPLQSGGKIRSGPQVGKLATSPLPYRGSPPLQSGGKIRSGPQVGKLATSPLPYRDPHRCRAGRKIRSGPQVGKVATSPLPYRGSPLLQSGGQNQKWPNCGQSGYLSPAVSGIPTAAERGAKSEVAHKWARWLPHPCCLGDPRRFRAGGKIRSGPQVGKVATSPLPYRGSPPLQSRGQNQKCPTSGQSGYLTSAVSGIPTAAERGAKSEVAHKWSNWLPHPCRIGDPHHFGAGAKSEVARKWANWLPHPCRIGDPHRFRAGGKIRSGPQEGKVATSPLPYRGSPPLQSGGAKSEVPHKWAMWLPHPSRIGDPRRFRAGGKIRSGPQVGKVATSPLPYRGSPPLQSRGQNQKCPTSGQSGYLTPAVTGIPTAAEPGAKSEVPHKWAKWLPHPCRIGDPRRFRAGGKIRSGPQVGKVATSPLPYRGSPLLQSGGQNQKWPNCGQSGYLSPAVSGIPTAAERGAKSEVAHKWARWLPHPCCLGDPRRFRAGGKIRSGPQVGKVATSPLPYRGSPPLQSRGQNQKCPTSGQSGYLTSAVSGIPTAAERGAKSEVAHKWSNWLPHPCRIGDPHHFGAGAKSEVARKWANWLPHPCRIGDPHRFRAGGKIRSGPQEGKVATSPLPYRGSPPLQSGGAKSEVPHKWAMWLPHPSRIGDPRRFRAGGKIRSGPQVGKVATSPLPYRGSPPLQSRGQNQKCPTSGQSGYLTPAVTGIPTAAEPGAKSEVPHKWAKWLPHPAVSGIPAASERGAKSEVAHKWAKWLPHPCRIGDPHCCRAGAKSEVAHKWAKWLPHPCRIGDPHRCRAGGKIRSGPQVGKVATSPLPYRGSPLLQSGGKIRSGPQVVKLATSPLPYRGSPPLQSGGQNQKWPTCGQSGYLTPAVSGIPTAAEAGAKSEVPHKWAKWLPHPCRIGDPHRCRAGGKIRSGPQVGKLATSPLPYRGSPPLQSGGKIRSGPQVGKLATSPLPYRGSPPLQSGGQNQKWPTRGQSGYLTPAVSGIPTAAERGAKSEVAHKWANWLPHPCRIGDPHRCRAGRKIRSGPQGGKVATSPLPYRGSPLLQSGGQNQKWPNCGQSGYLTPAVSGIPTAAERGAKSEVAHKWARCLPHPCCLGDPRRFRAGGKIRSGPQVGKVATSPLPYRGSPPLQSRGQNQKWPTSGQSGYLTPAVSGIPTAAERGAKSEVAHKWADWLPHPCRIGDPHRFRAGAKSEVAHKWAKWLPHPCRIGDPRRFRAGAKSEVAHKWAKWLPHPCRIGDPHRCRAGRKIRSGPQVGKVATSPLPYRGSPLLQSRGQNQKWPNCGQSGYLTPAVSGIPTAAERGAKSEVAHKWARWLPHPCCLGDPRRFRAGGKIRSGPQVGKVATSPLPYRGSPPLQSRGQNQKWPTSGQSGYLTPAVTGIPTAARRGGKSEVAHKWSNWLPHPCRIGDPHRFRAGGKIRSGPQVGKVATSPLP